MYWHYLLLGLLEEQFYYQMMSPEEQRQYRMNYQRHRENRTKKALQRTIRTFAALLFILFLVYSIFAIVTDM